MLYKVSDGYIILKGLERVSELGKNCLCGVVGVERTVFEAELIDDFRTVGDDSQMSKNLAIKRPGMLRVP